MKYLVAYDIAEPRRLRRFARICEDYGYRVQKSVFVCDLECARFDQMWSRLGRILKDRDTLLAWPICAACVSRAQVAGAGALPSEDLALVV